MSSDPLVQPSLDDTLTHSPPRESDATDDTVARLYFGPQTSPEKTLIKTMLRNDDNTPQHGSSRLAILSYSPFPLHAGRQAHPTDLRFETDVFNAFDSGCETGCETPDNNQDSRDEPSFVLANRIIRAHDNPSPPPRPHVDDSELISPRLDRFQDQSTSSQFRDSLPIPAIPDTPVSILKPNSPPQGENDASDTDLIVFTSFSLPSHTPHDSKQTRTFEPPSVPTVDDLLSCSPAPPGDVLHKESFLDQLPHPLLPSDQLQSSSIHDVPVNIQNPSLFASPSLPPAWQTEDPKPTPVRRSNRLSVSPQRSALQPKIDLHASPSVVAPLRLPSQRQKFLSGMGDLLKPPEESTSTDFDDRMDIIDSAHKIGRKRKRGEDTVEVATVGPGSLFSGSAFASTAPKADPDAISQTTGTPQTQFSSNLPHRVPVVFESHPFVTPAKLHSTSGYVNRTPVRRVPLNTTLGDGILPSKGQSGTRIFGGTVFKMQALDDPTRSPVRRVLVSDNQSSPKKDARNIMGLSKERSGSTEPRQLFNGRSASVEPVFSRPPNFSSSSSRKVTNGLPFPITPKAPTIPEEEDEHAVHSYPVKPRATSAPPAVPLKPVKSSLRQPTVSSKIPRIGNKPYARPPELEKSKLPVSVHRAQSSRNGNNNGSNADESRPTFSQASVIKMRREPGTKPSSATALRPQIVAMRQVPGIRAHERSRLSQNQIEGGPLNFEEMPGLVSNSEEIPDSPARQTRSSSRNSNHGEDSIHAPGVELSGVRRTSRARKNAPLLHDDLFGSGSSPSPEAPKPLSSKPRRKPPSEVTGYTGLSALVLKSITSNNTAKNQQIVNKLETEVIRKEGQRPESPTTKLRTVAERQKAEKTLQRQERAERRARKMELGEIAESDIDASFMSDLSLGDDGRPLKHRRGPGDEEDYETPDRPRPPKKAPIDGIEEESKQEHDKRVQWDRGLFSAIYLDELPETRRQRPRDENARRSCLAKTVKTIALDPLGNLQNADASAPHLVAERVVVKRFVYDGEDDLATVTLPEVKPLRVIKSKGRKAKT